MRKEIERSDIKAVEFPLKTKFIIIKTETDMQTPKLFLLLERFLFVFAKISKIPERNRTRYEMPGFSMAGHVGPKGPGPPAS